MQRRSTTRARETLLGALLLALAACIPRGDELTLTVADPSRVTVMSVTAGGGSGSEVIPTGTTAMETTLSDEPVAPEPGARTAVQVRAIRESGGALSVGFTTKLPLLNGDQHTLVGADGAFSDPSDLFNRISPTTLTEPHLRIDSCARLTSAYARGVHVGYRASVWEGCEGGLVSTPFAVETPWSNVVELRKREADYRPFTGSIIAIGAAMILSGALISATSTSCAGGCKGAIVSLVAFGASFEVVGIPAFFILGGPRPDVVYPAPGATR